MKRKRRHLTAEFKARIAFEALKEEKTIQQIAVNEDIAPTQISAWKRNCSSAWASFSSVRTPPAKALNPSEVARIESGLEEHGIRVSFLFFLPRIDLVRI